MACQADDGCLVGPHPEELAPATLLSRVAGAAGALAIPGRLSQRRPLRPQRDSWFDAGLGFAVPSFDSANNWAQ
jgi:hypothetical protein